jgi:stage III sporulation protein AF
MDMFLRTWIINIVAIGFLGVITDLLLSESDFRKFTRFVVGIIMLIAIIRPVLHLLHNPPAFDGLALNDMQAMRVEALRNEGEEKRVLAQERIMRLFIGNLQDQIEEQVRMLKGYESVEARIEFAEDENGNPDINALESISLTVSDKRVGGIENVNVDIISFKEEEDKSKYVQYTRQDEALVIREHLFEIYNVDKADIYLIFEEE